MTHTVARVSPAEFQTQCPEFLLTGLTDDFTVLHLADADDFFFQLFAEGPACCNRLERPFPYQVPGVQSELGAGCLIHDPDDAVRIQNDQCVVHRVDDLARGKGGCYRHKFVAVD
jgi:hypothetical protein